jgi:sialate O-acetylesterase
MIAPLQPFALRGFLWYQGESNVDRPNEYEELFPAMIRSWRSNWGDDTLPFYFVQIPNYADEDPNGRKWARLREAQTKALELPRTGMAVAIDVGDPGDLHPKTKMPIGVRLAHIAKTEIYDIPSDSSGPVFARATREGDAMRVSFTHATTGLVAHHRPAQALELAGADRIFHPAQGRIERDTIVVTSPLVKEPVAVRYAWTNAPDANLYNGSGLPAEPFRSDDW